MYLGTSRTPELGFTLIELLIALVLIGILVVIAVPSYLGLQARAADAAAKSNLRAAVPAAAAFAVDNTGTKGDADNKKRTQGYKGMTAAILRTAYDAGLSPTLKVVSGRTGTGSYCLSDKHQGRSWSVRGPGVASSSFSKSANCK
jgi:type IV pilus assembly protein PilA